MLPVRSAFSSPPIRCCIPAVPGIAHGRAKVSGSRRYGRNSPSSPLGTAVKSTSAARSGRSSTDGMDHVQQSAFGDIWSRPGLAVRDRSMVTVAVLAALGQTEELRAHLAGARNVGLTREELVEVLMHVSIYAGVPATNVALRTAADVLGVDAPDELSVVPSGVGRV